MSNSNNTFFIKVLCELLHVKLLEHCLEHSIAQILAVIIVLDNLHERRTLYVYNEYLEIVHLTLRPHYLNGEHYML